MAVYRVDVRTDDPDPIWDWIEAHVPKHLLVRTVGYHTVGGWYMKMVFKRQEDAEAFHQRWLPEAESHTVAAWGQWQH